MLLVTGITGHTGRYFLEELIKNRYQGKIRCVVREVSDTYLLDRSGLHIEKVIGDLNDLEFINRSMQGIKEVMHIYNIHHSPSILKAAIANKVDKVVLVHTTGIYSKFKYASHEYEEIEKKVNQLVLQCSYDIKVTILRPTMIYGDLCDANISKFIKILDKLRIIPIIDKGNSLLQPVNARDLGKAYYSVLTILNEVGIKAYNLSGEAPIRLIDMLKLISDGLGKKTIFINVPIKIGVLGANIVRVLTLNKINYVEKVQRMGEDRNYLHKDAADRFGYSPIFFKEGLHTEIEEYMRMKK